MSKRLLDLTLPKRATKCYACDEALASESAVYSLLREGEEAPAREDRCEGCWQGLKVGEDVWSSWKGKMPSKEKVAKQEMAKNSRERSLQLLREFLGQGSSKGLSQAYLLALYLERRGVIHRCKVLQRKSGRVQVYEVDPTGEAIHVPRQELVPEAEKLHNELLQVLRGCENPAE